MSTSSRVRAIEKPEVRAFPQKPPASQHGTDCGDLVRTILQRVAPKHSSDVSTQEVILETTIEGSRYLLIRLPSQEGPTASLSPREAEIVRMVSQGLPNKIIADLLNISCWTVSTHMRRIFAKLGVTSRAAMVAQMIEVHATRR